MPDSTPRNSNLNKTRLDGYGVRGIIREIGHSLIHLVVLLISAGKISWLNAWVCIGLAFIYQIVNAMVLIKFNPQLLNNRGRLVRENTKRFDKIFIPLFLLLGLIVSIMAGLDAVRYGWSSMSLNLVILGGAIYIFACVLGTWAMAVNRHFETTVFVTETQQVCATGPYRIVRHPGYVAAMIGGFGYTLILGSWWALAPLGGLVLLFVIRTVLEDRTLQAELPGYKTYTKSTRYRLIPYIW